MRTPALFLYGLTLLAAYPALAQNTDVGLPAAEIALSDDTLQLRYLTSGEMVNIDDGQLSAGFFLSEERDVVGTLGLLVPVDFDVGPVSFRLGPRAYAALLEEENNDVLSLALGAEVRFDLIRDRRIAIVGSAFYGPDILTFGSADQLTDLDARVEMRVTPRIVGFAGMRWFEMDLTEGGGERTLQEELIAGIRWQFD